MAQFDEGLLPSWKRGEECKRGKEREECNCPCLVTALLRGKSLTSLGPRLT